MKFINISTESIHRQSGNFFHELTKAVGRVRQFEVLDTDAINSGMLPSVIKSFTGVSTKIGVGVGYEIHIYPPTLTGTHAIFAKLARNDFAAKTSLAISEIKHLKGSIDIDKGVVSGDFSKILTPMFIGEAVLKDKDFTDEEIAACILHELGHIFTYYQFLSKITFSSVILSMTARAILEESDLNKRTIILKECENALGVDISRDRSDYISNPKPGLDVILLTDYMTSLPDGTLDAFYNTRIAEQLADTYAIKYCGAKHLATGILKYSSKHKWQRESFMSHLLAETVSFFKMLKEQKLYFVHLLFSGYNIPEYDDPDDRIEYMKLMLVDELKRLPTTDKLVRDQIVEEIKAIDEIKKGFKYRRDVVHFFWETIGKGRKHKKNYENRKALERMVYNDLFFKATQLRQLADKQEVK